MLLECHTKQEAGAFPPSTRFPSSSEGRVFIVAALRVRCYLDFIVSLCLSFISSIPKMYKPRHSFDPVERDMLWLIGRVAFVVLIEYCLYWSTVSLCPVCWKEPELDSCLLKRLNQNFYFAWHVTLSQTGQRTDPSWGKKFFFCRRCDTETVRSVLPG